jgi:hypothetical protein
MHKLPQLAHLYQPICVRRSRARQKVRHLLLPRHVARMTPTQPRTQQMSTPGERTQLRHPGATAYSLALGRTDRLCKVSMLLRLLQLLF